MTRLSEQLVAIWRGKRPNETAGSHRFTVGTEVAEKWEPQIVEQEQSLTPEVPTVPGVPTNFDKGHGRAEPSEAEELRFRWEERAAILEFEGGYDRTEAEARAWLEIARKHP